MSDKIKKIGVIGAGMIGRKHIEVLRSGNPNYALAAVADPSPQAHVEAEQLGYQCYNTVAELIDKAQPDGAIVAVPNQMHVDIGLLCVDRGIPILIEKPVADTVADAVNLIEAAEAAGVATLTGHHRRHNPIMRRAAELIASDAIGRVVAATSIWLGRNQTLYNFWFYITNFSREINTVD